MGSSIPTSDHVTMSTENGGKKQNKQVQIGDNLTAAQRRRPSPRPRVRCFCVAGFSPLAPESDPMPRLKGSWLTGRRRPRSVRRPRLLSASALRCCVLLLVSFSGPLASCMKMNWAWASPSRPSEAHPTTAQFSICIGNLNLFSSLTGSPFFPSKLKCFCVSQKKIKMFLQTDFSDYKIFRV